jgi:hypothetical protein
LESPVATSGRGFLLGGSQRNAGRLVKFETSAFHRDQMTAKRAKSANAPRYRSFSDEIELSFALSSLRYPAYPVASGNAGVRGPAAR